MFSIEVEWGQCRRIAAARRSLISIAQGCKWLSDTIITVPPAHVHCQQLHGRFVMKWCLSSSRSRSVSPTTVPNNLFFKNIGRHSVITFRDAGNVIAAALSVSADRRSPLICIMAVAITWTAILFHWQYTRRSIVCITQTGTPIWRFLPELLAPD